MFTASALGKGYVTATSGGMTTGTPIVVHAALTNVVPGGGATASTTNGTNVAKNVTNGNTTTTRRESTHGLDNQYIYVDLGKVYDLASVYIIWENAYAKTYDVEVATDLTQTQPWTVVTPMLTKTSSAADTVALANVTGRYL